MTNRDRTGKLHEADPSGRVACFDPGRAGDRDRLAAAARWSSGKNVGRLAETPVRLRIAMRSSKLYSFQFTG